MQPGLDVGPLAWAVLLAFLVVAIAEKLVFGEVSDGKIPTSLTLGVTAGVVTVSIGASLLKERGAPTLQPTTENR